MPSDVNLMPLVLKVSQGAFVHLAEIPQRRRVADERVDFILGWRIDFNGGEDYLQFLYQHALDFEKLKLVLSAELLAARVVDVMIELLPALQIVFHLGREVIHFFDCAHSWNPG